MGSLLTSGNISDRIHIQWARAGIWTSENMRLNTNLIRKSTTTDLLDRGSVYAKDAACLMMHSEKTAKEHYQLVQKKQSMQRGSKAIAGLYFPNGVVSAANENQLETALNHSVNSANENQLESASNPSANPNPSVNPVTTISPCSPPRKLWNQSEVNILSNITGSPKVVYKSPEAAKINATRRQIYDKVHSLRHGQRKEQTITSSQPRRFEGKQGRVSKWSEGQQKSIVDSGILDRKRVPFEEILNILPKSITDYFSESQIRTRLAYEKLKFKKIVERT